MHFHRWKLGEFIAAWPPALQQCAGDRSTEKPRLFRIEARLFFKDMRH
jgi:hypothetical protein